MVGRLDRNFENLYNLVIRNQILLDLSRESLSRDTVQNIDIFCLSSKRQKVTTNNNFERLGMNNIFLHELCVR